MNFTGYKTLLFSSILLLGATSSFGRVGPVSAYGELLAGTNSSGKGQIYGSCNGVSTGNEVAIQGMSLFWSIAADVGAPFWTADYVTQLVSKQNIQLIRAPMGVDEDWGAGNYFTNTSYYQGLMNTVVQAAIDNDIYVIIDYHSHSASDNVSNAKTFFAYMAEKWGSYDNVIFEIFNEPEYQTWSTIKTYADDVVATIRQYSDNLILVGNRYWDQYPNEAVSDPVTDSQNNTAYTFHFYAGSHYTTTQGLNAVSAMNSGLSVFVSEYGTVDASGDGNFSSSNSATWYSWMQQHNLSGANWSVSTKDESASYFSGSAWNYSESGQWVNSNVFANLPTSYTACSGTATSSSSSIESSSSSQPEGTTDYIDDFEDGDNYAYTGGEWYAYTDVGDNGASTISNGEGTNGGYNVIIAGSSADNSTNYVAGITGINLSQGDNEYDPYVALGLGLNETQTEYDLSACNTITYKYKGAAHNFKTEDTQVTDYGYHQISKLASTSWTTATISWDMLIQDSWATPVTLSKERINKLTWEVKGSTTVDYLYIDDVRCSGMAIVPVTSTSSSSSTSDTQSSSSVISSSSAGQSSSSSISSSSITSSSSISSSSVSSTGLEISGSLTQTVTQGSDIETVTITGVTSYSRNSWNAYFITATQSGTTLTFTGSVDDYLGEGTYSDTYTINGEEYTLTINVVSASSSSSESSSSSQNAEESSSSSGEVITALKGTVGSSIQMHLDKRVLFVNGTNINVDVFDMQGRPVARFRQASGSLSLEHLNAGRYIIRATEHSNSVTKQILLR